MTVDVVDLVEAEDPAFTRVHKLLRSNGFSVIDKGGREVTLVNGDGYDYPSVVLDIRPDQIVSEADRLVELLTTVGVAAQPMGWRDVEWEGERPDWDTGRAVEIQATYDPTDESASIVVFHLTDELLTDVSVTREKN